MNIKLEVKYRCGEFGGNIDFETPINNSNFRFFRNLIIKKIHDSNINSIGHGIDESNELKAESLGIKIKSRQIRNILKQIKEV